MSDVVISYLITCNDEFKDYSHYSEVSLLNRLYQYRVGNECIFLHDSKNPILPIEFFKGADGFFQYYRHGLNNHYGEHKNYGKRMCKGKYIFQIDADEIPNAILLESLPELIALNEDIELFWVPRINDFIGVNQENAAQWGWRLSPYENRLIVNWPDPQGRLFKNLPHLRWERRVHEKVEGAKTFSYLPSMYELALHHNKTIETQIATNLKYNTLFTGEENQGFKLQ